MSQVKKPTGLEHFSRLNPAVFLHEPATTSNASSTHSPDLILIAGWMDATPRPLSKYAAQYEKLYPSARIIVILTSAVDSALRTASTNFNRVKPVLDILYALPADGKLLLHFFSNGGTYTSTMIARHYREKMGKPLPVTAMVLDSCPGHATYEATYQAFTVGLPKSFIGQTIGALFFRLALFLYFGGYMVMGIENAVERARREANDKTLLDIDAPRIYVYSVADKFVTWQDVEKHAKEAKEIGYTVEAMEKYEDTPHAGHMISDEKRYWAAVQKLWSTVS
ncbi:hypothetical protein B0J14DRAFT_220428 [Halenospora varia]|nr:hypothetical protein B0J14DRAFT_220428 [Halenospora varia]